MSLSLGSSQYSPPYSPPAFPDVHGCDIWYSTNPDPNNYTTPVEAKDCKEAFRLLPDGTDLLEWAINPFHKNSTHSLPYNSTWGTCTIQLHASGPSASDTDHISIAGDTIRQMAGYLLQSCVLQTGTGGFVINSLINAVNTVISAPYQDALPPSTTYFSLSLGYTPTHDPDWNPGDMEPAVSRTLTNAIARHRNAAVDTPSLRQRSGRALTHYLEIREAMRRARHDTWWGPRKTVVTGLVGLNESCGGGTEQSGTTNMLCLSGKAGDGQGLVEEQ